MLMVVGRQARPLGRAPRAGSRRGTSSSSEIRRAASLDSEKVRAAILKLDLNTVFGAFKVDPNGVQTTHRGVIFQWQDGKKVIVWPEEIAPVKARFPTPPWSERP